MCRQYEVFRPSAVRTLIRSILPAIFLLLLSVPVFAVTMDVTPGFGGAVKAGEWTPIMVKLANPGGNQIQGDLLVDQNISNKTSFTACSCHVDLPANSSKEYRVYAKFENYGDVTVMLVEGSAVRLRKKLNLDLASSDSKLVVSVGDRTSRLNFLSGDQVQGTPKPQQVSAYGAASSGPRPFTIHVGSVTPPELPDRPSAYDSVDVLVLSDLSPTTVSPKALKAVQMWVASGGTLVVSGGPHYQTLQNDFYNELLPVTVNGTLSLSNSSVLARLGKTAAPVGGMAVTNASAKNVCNSLEMEGGVPVYAGRDYGAGKVIFLAFDHLASPFKDWNGQTAFWKGIITGNTGGLLVDPGDDQNRGMAGGYPYNQGLTGVVQQNPSIKTPSLNVIGGYLILYLIMLVPVNYHFLKKRRRLELAWATVPCIVFVFALGAYGIGYMMKGGQLQMNSATIIEGSSGCRYASAVNRSSLFSPARRTYSLEMSDPYGLTHVNGGGQSDIDVSVGETTALDNVSMAMWSSKTFCADSGADLGGVIVPKLTLNAGQLTGEIVNNTGLDLDDCAVVYGDGVYKVGRLGKGGSGKVDVSYIPSSGRPVGPMGPGSYSSGPNSTETLDQRVSQYTQSSLNKANSPILFAKVRSSDSPFNMPRDHASITSVTYCAIRLSYQTGDSAILSGSAIQASVVEAKNANKESQEPNGDFMMGVTPGGYYTQAFKLTIPTGNTLKSIKVVSSQTPDVTMGGPGMKGSGGYGPGAAKPTASVEIKIQNNSTGSWDKLATGSTIEKAGRYLNSFGEVKVRVKNSGRNGTHSRLAFSAVVRRK